MENKKNEHGKKKKKPENIKRRPHVLIKTEMPMT